MSVVIPPGETVIETRTCRLTGQEFVITDKDREFYEKISPVFGDKQYSIPFPTLCPEARQQRRMTWRNERKLYKRICDFSGREIVSMFSSDKPYTVYAQDIWWSDTWDPLSYGREFDFERSAMEQFWDLLRAVPRPNLHMSDCENTEYANHSGHLASCYLVSASWESRDTFFAQGVIGCTNTLDALGTKSCEECYECVDTHNCWRSQYCVNVRDSRESTYLINCQGCQNCFWSSGLINAQYYFRNEPYSPDIYAEKVREFLQTHTRKGWEVFTTLHGDTPQVNTNTLSESSTGHHLSDVRESHEMTYFSDAIACKFVTHGMGASDTYDGFWVWAGLSLGYELVDSWVKASRQLFGIVIYESSNTYYCHTCYSCNNLFLCTGLRNKQYCILNKQYTREEYEQKVPKIIEKMIQDGQWWEFFPASMSPFGYNETVASEYLPLSKQEAIKQGFTWSGYEAPVPSVEKIIPADKLPDTIETIPDDVINWAIRCEKSGKLFKVIAPELAFYRKHNIPLPRLHPDERHTERLKQRSY